MEQRCQIPMTFSFEIHPLTPYSLRSIHSRRGRRLVIARLAGRATATIYRLMRVKLCASFLSRPLRNTLPGPDKLSLDAISLSDGPLPGPLPAPTPAPPGLYGGTRNGELLSLDLSTGAGTQIGTLPGFGSTEIEFNNTTRRGYTQFPDGVFAGQEFDMNDGEGIGNPNSTSGSFTGLEWVGSSLYATMITQVAGLHSCEHLIPLPVSRPLSARPAINNPISGLAYDETSGDYVWPYGRGLGRIFEPNYSAKPSKPSKTPEKTPPSAWRCFFSYYLAQSYC